MAELSIGELSARSGVPASAIRYYENEGLIEKPPRRSGRRVFAESALWELAVIELAKRAGFRLAEIRRLLSGFSRREPPGGRWRALTLTKLEELDERIAEAQRMKTVLEAVAKCRCPTLEDCGRAMQMRGRAGEAQQRGASLPA